MSARAATATGARPGWDRVTELTPPVVLPVLEALELLERGEITVQGRITTASNATLYCAIELSGMAAACVYKPVSGERPLWDFPDGTLAEREVATYLVAAATGWEPVPPTVLREGPLGTGMVQLWIAHDESFDIVGAINSGQLPALQRMALLDAVVNNSDRKISHLLPVTGAGRSRPAESELHVYGVDHGVSFATENKLRTVLWQWAGDPIPEEGIDVLRRLAEQLQAGLGEQLSRLLTGAEVRAARRRVQRLLSKGTFPMPPTDWPAIPYPPY
ncbi:SCO1664 family protein [Jatrophihabitans sp.]|uniref:SCO1664 family protein n=1 Tax=Jatrophihabitans sp. TaxID=1932789 RepID=UPI0038CD5EBC